MEEDFQAVLDAQPDDWQTRLVFADWLEERGDSRAAGYRELGRRRLHPVLCIQSSGSQRHYIVGDSDSSSPPEVLNQYRAGLLPRAWFSCCRTGDAFSDNASWKFYDTRRAADDAAADGYVQMMEKERSV